MNMNGRGVIVIMIWTALLLLLYYYLKSRSKSDPESFIPKIQNNPVYEFWDNVGQMKFGPNMD